MRFVNNKNYMLALFCCLACSVLSALSGASDNYKFLILSDLNVATWLFIA